MWCYDSEIGELRIIEKNGIFVTFLNGEEGNWFCSAKQAADSFADHSSGIARWDDSQELDPSGLSDFTFRRSVRKSSRDL